MKSYILLLFTFLSACGYARPHKAFTLTRGKDVTLSCPPQHRPVLSTAIGLFGRDIQNVLGCALVPVTGKADIIVRIDPKTVGKPQGFSIKVLPDGTLSVTGHDSHGAAYGVLEISRLMGVSPWEWWADAIPFPKDSFQLPAGYRNEQSPAVAYRGFFINDEDWGLMPWSSLTYEPQGKRGRIGPETNKRIFELLLRLRANYYWPAMHECTEPFFLTEGNRKAAEQYGIYIGGSHCEPMASSTAVEWSRRGKGEYDYVNNSENVLRFWEERVKEVAGQEIVYTLGMRGVHDGAMNGAQTVEEQKSVLERAIAAQRRLLSTYVSKEITAIPQVFIPYKEVLDVYTSGLDVPEDVTLMWCDDNYGYIRHFPTKTERNRKGGNGIYYHVSYWGRPHDYLWLGTFSPGLLYQQMSQAYDRGIRQMWILNVGDIKPAEYQTELFLDMAWNIRTVRKKGVGEHLRGFLQREFGLEAGQALLPLMQEHFRLAYIRKPEFMGNTREEERYDKNSRAVKDLPWTEDFIRARLDAYTRLSDTAETLTKTIAPQRQDTYLQLVKYPVQAAAQMNRKMLCAQLARHGKTEWLQSRTAHDSIAALTEAYNNGIANEGKWNRMMDCRPRRLPLFDPVQQTALPTALPTGQNGLLYCWNGKDGTGNYTPCEALGYDHGAVGLRKKRPVSFSFPHTDTDSVIVEIRLVPTHPVSGNRLAFTVQLDDRTTAPISYQTQGRSEEWKQNVLRNQAIRKVTLPSGKSGRHRIRITALDEGIILDQVIIYDANRYQPLP